MILALVLSSVAIIMSAIVATSYIKVQSVNLNIASVVIPKFAGGNEKKLVPHKNSTDAQQRLDEFEATEADFNSVTIDISDNDQGQQSNIETPVSTVQPSTQPKASSPKVAYLTFDDGPSKYMDEIVDILNEYGIHGTFFVIGNQIEGNESSIKSASEQGHYIGLHSMTHDKKILYKSGSSLKFLKEFNKVQSMVEEITGSNPWLIRAPYGSKPQIDKEFRNDIVKAGYKMWDWTVDSKDWKFPDRPDKVLQEIKRQVHREVEVILLHEKKQTVEALPQIIEFLTNKGYAFAVYKPDQHFSVNFANDSRL
ncbi:polysaccharide deacetylase [Paenibacillus lentus]|uniref:Polysaccharide deacetylase n=2 Tax=Paenibacillus lentus TaxID=1338368 RepID=A0A3Q8S7R3_9BACL|nr:polysaccharide deacetylase [Paenibacillus lentus]